MPYNSSTTFDKPWIEQSAPQSSGLRTASLKGMNTGPWLPNNPSLYKPSIEWVRQSKATIYTGWEGKWLLMSHTCFDAPASSEFAPSSLKIPVERVAFEIARKVDTVLALWAYSSPVCGSIAAIRSNKMNLHSDGGEVQFDQRQHVRRRSLCKTAKLMDWCWILVLHNSTRLGSAIAQPTIHSISFTNYCMKSESRECTMPHLYGPNTNLAKKMQGNSWAM